MFLAVDKPARISSFDVIRILRRHFPKQKIGHSGTLDPMATGLMILALGQDTKNLAKIIGLDKEYVATIDFSKLTDTWDMEYREDIKHYEPIIQGDVCVGLEMEYGSVEAPVLSEITRKLDQLIPSHDLPLPAFSAKKRNGQRSYHAARLGDVATISQPMKIHGYTVLEYTFPLLQIRIAVGSGTYIRSIAYRLGTSLWLGGTLIQLRRTSIGDRDIAKIAPWQTLENVYKDKQETIAFAQIDIV